MRLLRDACWRRDAAVVLHVELMVGTLRFAHPRAYTTPHIWRIALRLMHPTLAVSRRLLATPNEKTNGSRD